MKGPSYKVVYLEKLCKHSCIGKCFKCMQSTFAFENICFDYISYSQADTYSQYSIHACRELQQPIVYSSKVNTLTPHRILQNSCNAPMHINVILQAFVGSLKKFQPYQGSISLCV